MRQKKADYSLQLWSTQKAHFFVDVECDTMLLLTKATETQLFPHTDLFSYFDASGMKFNASTKSKAAKESRKCL